MISIFITYVSRIAVGPPVSASSDFEDSALQESLVYSQVVVGEHSRIRDTVIVLWEPPDGP